MRRGNGTGRLTVVYWLTAEDGTERQSDRAEWNARTLALGIRPQTMGWSAPHVSGRQEYVLPGGQ